MPERKDDFECVHTFRRGQFAGIDFDTAVQKYKGYQVRYESNGKCRNPETNLRAKKFNLVFQFSCNDTELALPIEERATSLNWDTEQDICKIKMSTTTWRACSLEGWGELSDFNKIQGIY